jgi:hypothetical protein
MMMMLMMKIDAKASKIRVVVAVDPCYDFGDISTKCTTIETSKAFGDKI